jgi:UDP-3-O-[3-hydroxymyristoyl] glucosamine N-acyltransferase
LTNIERHNSMSITAAQIAEQLNGEILGDGSIALTGFAPTDSAGPGDLTFAEKAEYLAAAERSDASAVLVPAGFTSSHKALIRVSNPRVAVARVLPLFFPPDEPPRGLDAGARIAGTAAIDPTAFIGPGCVIGERARVGARTVLLGGNHVGRDVAIGADTWLYPIVVAVQQLPDWIRRLRELEREVEKLRKLVGSSDRPDEPVRTV